MCAAPGACACRGALELLHCTALLGGIADRDPAARDGLAVHDDVVVPNDAGAVTSTPVGSTAAVDGTAALDDKQSYDGTAVLDTTAVESMAAVLSTDVASRAVRHALADRSGMAVGCSATGEHCSSRYIGRPSLAVEMPSVVMAVQLTFVVVDVSDGSGRANSDARSSR
ncbi:uncharacterized protein MYCGRDRAFT_90487 [Zymoseptoria tritici IPO323]|uniref:Uncharacterized protein n=1 Tax=Zymoseptoria tritici (strain CBS 115943 / IPO323) TaxID=336722 RepID=F9X477_ZYMTI|nr:uncharacterized protein MYCGRDRAFT_90487 [Zymoseptoria tritici IPO323]EGP89775.1 hypothetical protein MYCGRDRAFT_90487 [Zymoseptoria tritici IPO323]